MNDQFETNNDHYRKCLAWSKVPFAIAFCAFCVGHQRNDSCAALFQRLHNFHLGVDQRHMATSFFRPKQQRTAESFTCASVIHLALLVTAFDIVIAGRRANVKSNRSLLRTSRISEADGSAWTYGSSYATYRSSSAGFQ
ncbi:hypothetical protein D917_06321 [Trichinella nativa]|uniref:Uncharacterized protein n=1 Tax=Trichinella nativa TaxID=6335 RepID=A0A1Y3ESV2_9BILA|nr:hypothetical protein D917_06321 [Trichinella nativa]